MPPTTLADEGTVVVTMASVLDALEGIISAEQREAILLDLVGVRSEDVAPGDLITADLFNRMRSDINDLALRVATLEASSAVNIARPEIFSITPNPARVGEDIEILGANLNPDLLNAISIDESRVPLSRIRQGSPSRLVLAVPSISGLQAGPLLTTVTVNNPAGSAQAPLVVRPAENDVFEVGVSIVSLTIDPVGEIEPNATYELAAEIRFTSSVAQQYRITPILTVADEEGNWSLTPEEIDIAVPLSNDQPFTATLNMELTTGTAGAGSIAIEVEGREFAAATDTANVTAQPITVAEDVVLPSQDITLDRSGVRSAHASFNEPTLTLSVLSSNSANVILDLTFLLAQAGNYTVAPLTATGGWTLSQPAGWTQSTPGTGRRLTFTVTPGSSAGTVPITISGPNGTQPYSATLNLVRVTTLPTN